MEQVILKKLESPQIADPNEDVEWICRSLGFISERDKDKTAARIFHAIIDAAVKRMALTSDQLADTCNISRGAVIYHMHNYMDSGLLIRERTRYLLRVRSLEHTMEEIEQDTMRIFANLKRIAREIDGKLGLNYR